MKRLLFFASLLIACTDEEGSRRALEGLGMTEIEFTGYEFMTCSNESFHTGFTAKNPQGRKVSGVVCCGWFKNCTVRF